MEYPALHRHAEKVVEFSGDVENVGQPMGTTVLAGQYALAGQGCETPFWQKRPGRQLSHCHPPSATLLLATRYVPSMHVQFEAGRHVVKGGQAHCAGRLAPGSEKVPLGQGSVLLTALPGQ